MFIPNNSTVLKLQTAEDLQGYALLHYDVEMEFMNLILLSIPNDIYNSVDACTSANDMWKRVERLMRGTIQNKVDRETHFTNQFDQFVVEPREALVSVYNRFAYLQLEWLKYVTQVHLAKRLTVDTFDDLFDYLQQFEKLVNVSRAKNLEKSHDPLALDDVHNNSKDPLTSAMLNSGNVGRNNRRAYVQEEIVEGSNALNETGNVQRTLRTSSSGNTSTVQCYNCSGKGHYARNFPKPRVRDSKYFMEQMMEEIKELSANICLMDKIQPADNISDVGPSYDSAFISEVQSSSNNENEEQMYPTHTKIINSTIGDDQIDSDIIFDSPNGNVNSGSIEKDTHVPDLCALEQLARNAYQEAEKQQIFAQKKHGLDECVSMSTLMETKRLDADLQGTPTNQTNYRCMIKGLMYLIASRPDIAFATFVCARYQARPTVKYLKEVKWIFCTSGGLQFLGGKLVSWSSKKQDCTVMSTAEAEYVSLSACCAQVIWMRTQLLDYRYKYNRISMCCDSKSAIAISCNPVQHFKTKHIDSPVSFIKEHVGSGTVGPLTLSGQNTNLRINLLKLFQKNALSIYFIALV
ncbi:integrase, catalytic region, zinc finger, CCHC-type containing protein [Tanacetum coccineum]